MASGLSNSGAALAPSSFAPLHTNRMITGMWSNSNPLRDAATPLYIEKYQGGRNDRINDGYNSEISGRLTLRRRPGLSVYNSQIFPPIRRYYGWNTFSTTDEFVRVMVDTDSTVYDATGPSTKLAVFQKSPGAVGKKTYFLGVGNTLYMTNGVDNKQLSNATGVVTEWGVAGPTAAPTAGQAPRPNPYYSWVEGTVYAISVHGFAPFVVLLDPNGNLQVIQGAPSGLTRGNAKIVQGPPPIAGTTGTQQPSPWGTVIGHLTPDGTTLKWRMVGPAAWQANHTYGTEDMVAVSVNTAAGMRMMAYVNTASGGVYTSGPNPPHWLSGLGTLTADANGITWLNVGLVLDWTNNIGPNTPVTSLDNILDTNGYTQKIVQAGKTGPSPGPTFASEPGDQTIDGSAIWQNTGPYAVGGTDAVQYGYAFEASATVDISNMSPASLPIVVMEGNQVTVQGYGTGVAGVDTIVLYRTEQGGAIFYFLASFPNPGAGVQWSYTDNTPDSGLNTEIEAQVLGEGTPPPVGATCMEYHLGRIWVAAGNVIYGSSGPDAVVSGSSGNAGFNLSFTAQSKVIRLWANSNGLIVYTVRDSYVIAQDSNSGTLYMQKYIENLPLLSYDAFSVHLTTSHLFTGNRMLLALDPSAGIVEASFAIADKVAAIDPTTAYCTYHTGPSGETAMYLSDGASLWYRMSPTSAPETGIMWHPAGHPAGGMSAMQSVEVLPGVMSLLIGPAASGPILQRDPTKNTDNGVAFTSRTDIGSVVMALPGQLAGLAWMTLEATIDGSAPGLAVLLDEIEGVFEAVPRTRQDPTNLPPSKSLRSNRYSLLQSQRPVWCRHLQYSIQWPAEDAANELLTTTIFGQQWQEMRSQ